MILPLPPIGRIRPICLISLITLLLSLLLSLTSCSPRPTHEVVAYIAQDPVYAQPLLDAFTRETGIAVKTVFDSEAVKTVGLANRLLAERRHPQCDVFWGNEELRTRQLAALDVWQPTNGWASFGYRSRRIVIHTNHVALPGSPPLPGPNTTPRLPAPSRLDDLTNHLYQGRIALAYPLFGTTATYFLALRQHWGETRFTNWCHHLAANRPLVVDGNSVVARLVARGEAWIGLTDSDDIVAVQQDGAPVVALPLTDEALLIPNTVGIVRHAPHPAAAARLAAWLQRPDTIAHLVRAGALEGPSATLPNLTPLAPDWSRLVAELDPGMHALKTIFLR